MMDETVLRAIQQLTGLPWLDSLMAALSWLGNKGLVWIIIALVLLARRQTRRFGLACACALLLSLLLCNLLLKNVVARPRPYELFMWLQPLIPPLTDFSFPSGHTSSAFAAASSFWGGERHWVIAAWILAALIAFSRLYVGVHFPTDVLAGMVLGLVCGWLGRLIGGRVSGAKS